MKKILTLLILLLATVPATADTDVRASANADTAVVAVRSDSLLYTQHEIDSIAAGTTSHRPAYATSNVQLSPQAGRDFVSFFERFSRIDSSYIEPQHYNYAAMLQNTNTYEVYRISNNSGLDITLAPRWNYKLGPYFGWRWIFLGYTLDINHLDFSHDDSQREELDMSLYTNLFGIDFYYRKSGDDYKVRRMNLGDGVNTKPMIGAHFSGFRSSVKGFNFYYIFNHRRFSYPAAFSQSTVQRRSAGSPLFGFAWTVHKVSVDWNMLQELVDEHLGADAYEAPQDSAYRGLDMKYTDLSLTAGYAYNWVFAHNWLLSASLSAALAYKHSYSTSDTSLKTVPGFSFRNLGVDGIGRFALVYNNTKWYCGLSSTLNAFNYNKSRIAINTVFGNLNIYVGFNFGRKKEKQDASDK